MSDVARQPAPHQGHDKPFDTCPSDRPQERLAPFPAHVDLGEHIVGSDHVLDVLAPHLDRNACTRAVRSYTTFLPVGQSQPADPLDPTFALHDARFKARKPDQPKADPPSEPSTDPAISFFTMQKIAAVALHGNYATFVRELRNQQSHRFASDPKAAIGTLSAVQAGFEAAAGTAVDEQRKQTEQQWIALVARSYNGADTVRVATGDERTTTKLTKTEMFGALRGVLKIRVELPASTRDAFDAVPRVVAASISGVAQPVADQLLAMDLATAAMPIVIAVDDGGMISRDEVGRVRVTRGLPVADERFRPGRDDEEQRHRSAQALCARVLAKTLQAWGLEKIATTDGSRSAL